MEPIQQPTPPPPTPSYSQRAPSQGIFGSRIPSAIAFAVGILLFLLPFSEIRCNNTVFMDKTGIGFVLGQDWKVANNTFGNESKDATQKTNSEKEGNAQYFAIAALALAVLGLLFSFGNARSGGSAGMVTGILSAGSLVGLMIEVKRWFNASLAKEAAEKANTNTGDDTLGLNKIGDTLGNSMHLGLTLWFYIALIAFLAAAFFSYMRRKAK
ncbi:MAG: hypothetical protein IT214_05995 [Chitinophagaceae bacterium]|nr:hypothetical protein [Chitinophagaceae bacterium]